MQVQTRQLNTAGTCYQFQLQARSSAEIIDTSNTVAPTTSYLPEQPVFGNCYNNSSMYFHKITEKVLLSHQSTHYCLYLLT